MLLPEKIIESEKTASDIMIEMARNGYDISFSYNWFMNRYILKVEHGNHTVQRLISPQEANDAIMKIWLNDAIIRINEKYEREMKGGKE